MCCKCLHTFTPFQITLFYGSPFPPLKNKTKKKKQVSISIPIISSYFSQNLELVTRDFELALPISNRCE